MREYLGLMTCTSWSMRTGLVHRLRQWNRKLLAFCRDQGGGVGCADREEDRGTAIAGPGVVDVSFVEAAWDLDD